MQSGITQRLQGFCSFEGHKIKAENLSQRTGGNGSKMS
jgi:hypothetical protein